MILIFDLGNTRLKWGVVLQQQTHFQGVLLHRGESLHQQLDLHLSQTPRPQQIYMSSVADEVTTKILIEWLKEKWKITPTLIHVDSNWEDLALAYDIPQSFGVDRWLSLIAAQYKFPNTPCIVADLGSCVTVDAMDASGKHLGGFIFPGLFNLKQSVWSHIRSRDTVTHEEKQPFPLASNTEDAINGGSIFLIAAGIAQLRQDLNAESNSHYQCILTGGDALLAAPLLQNVKLELNLVLEGMAVVVNRKVSCSRMIEA